MKAKYKHYGNDCIIYNQIICEDNILTEVEIFDGWFGKDSNTKTTVCTTSEEAKRKSNKLCKQLDKYCDCEYCIVD